jgi:hypothetical protein
MAMLDKYIKQAPINNMNEWVNSISLLFSETPLNNWKNVMLLFPDDHVWIKIHSKRPYKVFNLVIVVPRHAMNRNNL